MWPRGDDARRLESPETRVVVGGFSQGGAIALSASLQSDAANVVGTVGASCYLPLAETYNANNLKRHVPNAAIKRPVCVCHGDEDLTVRSAWGEKTVDVIREIGVLDVRWHVFEGLGHSANDEEFAVIADFIAEVARA